MLVKFKMIYARNLHIDFLAKFTLRPPTEPDAQSVNLRIRLSEMYLIAFLSANLYKKFARRAFCFNSPSIRNLRARFTAVRATRLYTAARLYAFFSLFLHLSAPIFDFFPCAPCVKFCRFARSIRSRYERTCAQTPNFRAAVINARFEGTNEVFARHGTENGI